MSQKQWFFIGSLTLVLLLACNLSTPPSPNTSQDPTQLALWAGQTVAAVETVAVQQTLTAAGGSSGEVVPPPPGATPTNTNPPPPPPPPGATPSYTPSQTSIPCNLAHFEADVTIPDNWTTVPNDHFTKTWRVRNIGTCAWNSSYTATYDHGNQMGAPGSQPITGTSVAPGATVDISLPMVSPSSAGNYEGWYRLRAPDNSFIFFDNSVCNCFGVIIKVVIPTNTPTTSFFHFIPDIPFAILPTVTEVTGVGVHVPNGDTNYTKATCPSGKVVVGGGFSTGGGKLNLYQSHPHENGWEIFAKNNGSPSDSMNAFAECLAYGSSVSTSWFSQSDTAPGFGNGHAQVTCPAGTIMTGGGFDAGSNMRVFNSSPFGNGWQMSAYNGSLISGTVKAYAFCLSGTTGSSTNISASVNVAPHSSGGTIVTCPSGKLATGGGFALSGPMQIYLNNRGSSSLTWNADADNNSGGTEHMTVFGICLSIP
jgi:hypothetical protein